ncbi:MAG: hypothetical protein VX663_07080 [Pseudomonadota bacterium]|nr:hypothetical protein [Pseudomonadota bacterium]
MNSVLVMWDTRSPALLYVFPLQDSAEKVGKCVVRVNFRKRGNNLNFVRSGGSLDPRGLAGAISTKS